MFELIWRLAHNQHNTPQNQAHVVKTLGVVVFCLLASSTVYSSSRRAKEFMPSDRKDISNDELPAISGRPTNTTSDTNHSAGGALMLYRSDSSDSEDEIFTSYATNSDVNTGYPEISTELSMSAKTSGFLQGLRSRLSSLSFSPFWGREVPKKRQLYQEALAEYTAEVNQQTDQIKAVQEGLARCLEAHDVHNRELRQELEMLAQQSRLNNSSMFEVQDRPADLNATSSPEDERINKQAQQIRQQLMSYPELPEYGQLSAEMVQNTLQERREHHTELLALAHQFIPANFLNLAKRDETPEMKF
ncbi:MAG: hypothetical protein K0Q74_956 [Gammaproteobacteria bacterium]|jgi:hypothetical protein|nr:hypothetical protein [Gammaproteobacteria bacterium]